MNEIDPNNIGVLIEPAPITFEFGAPGWSILATTILCISFIIGLKIYFTYRKNKYRRLAVKELQILTSINNEETKLFYDYVLMLKKVALISYGKPIVGHLFGTDFLAFLRKQIENEDLFANSEIIFSKSLYQDNDKIIEKAIANAFYKDSIHWINKHRV